MSQHAHRHRLLRIVNALRADVPEPSLPREVALAGAPEPTDAGFGVPWMYKICEENGLSYTLGFSSNARLKKQTEELMRRAVAQYEQTKEKARLFECFDYQCDAWPHPRRGVAKAECHDQGTNLRFVVTNLPDVDTPEQAEKNYDHYVQRGESEHRMDELKNGLHMDRLSCHRFMANFFRLLLHVAAMNLLGALRQSPQLPQELQVGQPCTWQTLVIKVAAIVVQSTRRVVVKVAANWPWWPMASCARDCSQ